MDQILGPNGFRYELISFYAFEHLYYGHLVSYVNILNETNLFDEYIGLLDIVDRILLLHEIKSFKPKSF